MSRARKHYLLDTHTLLFWNRRYSVSDEFIDFIDEQLDLNQAFVSSVSFWETSLLVQKNRIEPLNVEAWKNELLTNTTLKLLNPSATEMINSVQLPQHHKDPFDRLLISQAQSNGLVIITRDSDVEKYDVETYWMK